jgi:hypothetical protein
MLAALAMLAAAPMGQTIAPAIDLAPERLSAVTCGSSDSRACDANEQERYRLPLPVEPAPLNQPDRAFNEDGRECGLIGHTVCTGKARAIIGTGEHAEDSLAARIEALDE